jgi:cell division inhibitor SulA
MPKKILRERTRFPSVTLDAPLAAQVTLLLMDPLSRKVRWGAWQNLISRLVREWVQSQRRDPSEAEVLRTSTHADLVRLEEGASL